MPKVSPEHLEQRRLQIVEAASRCFAANGFSGTSMQDIFKEAGLSAGAVYRYFPSKAELVSEIAKGKRGAVEAGMRAILEREELPPLPEAVREVLAVFLENVDVDGKLRLLPEGWAAALHDEFVGEIVTRIFTGVRGIWTEFAVRYQREGRLAPGADPAAVGALLTCFIPGLVMQRLMLGDVDAEVIGRGLAGVADFA